MHFTILSLFPEYFNGPFSVSMIKRACENKLVTLSLVNIRDFSKDRHQKVDDRPYGGGPGMVLSPEPVVEAIRSVKAQGSHVVYLSPQGKLLNHESCKRLATYEHVVLLCGHYEGIDERVIHEVDEEISIGDYILTSGCAAATVVVDSVIRFIPGVLGNPLAAEEDSFGKGRDSFEGPQYTRPYIFEGEKVPEVLLSGNHAEIAKYRKNEGRKKGKVNRPDLFKEE